MSITAALIVFAVTWFMVFYMVLPMRFQSQQDAGAVVPGTPKSAPSSENVKKKALVTTGIAVYGAEEVLTRPASVVQSAAEAPTLPAMQGRNHAATPKH